MVIAEAQLAGAQLRVKRRIRVRDARVQVHLTQPELARLAATLSGHRVSVKLISKSENGQPIRLLSAQAILDALNHERTKRNLPLLEKDDLDWVVQGDGDCDDEEGE